ncbi:MAG TPA: long-chain fatty acid--CoA ligase [Candidatus Limnocylindria bacterium]
MNAGAFLTNAAAVHGDRPAIVFADRVITYAELEIASGRAAGGLLHAGLRPGDRILLWMRNHPEFVISLFAGLRAGLTVVPTNVRLHPREVGYIATNSGAAAIIHDAEFESAATRISEESGSLQRFRSDALPQGSAALSDPRPEDPAWLFYTSGTTGKPKGATLTHRNLAAMTTACLADLCSFQPEDVVLHVAPLTHGSGLYLLPAIARGASNVISHHASFDPSEVFALIEHHHVSSIAFVVPTMIVRLSNDPGAKSHRLASLRTVIYGGAPMYVEDLRKAVQMFGQIFVQLYGQGETPMTGTYIRAADHRFDGAEWERRMGSIGIPRSNVEIRILDANDRPQPAGEVGEIVVRGDTVMQGYWRDPEATRIALRDGWLHTGDLGYVDGGGYVFLVDRAKDMIISAGNNIYAREVEEALLTHPAVGEVAVVGVPDADWGESVHAVVVLRAGQEVEPRVLIQHCKDRIASYKKPRTVEFIAELPKSAYGKVLKRELRERYLRRA